MIKPIPLNRCILMRNLEPDSVAEAVAVLKEQAAAEGCAGPWFYQGERLGSMIVYWDVSAHKDCPGFTRTNL